MGGTITTVSVADIEINAPGEAANASHLVWRKGIFHFTLH